MRKVSNIAYPILLVSGLAMVTPLVGQTVMLKLSHPRQIRKGVDPWPTILNPTSDAERRINGHLKDLNASLDQSLKDCDEAYAGSPLSREHPASGDGEGAESWTQNIEVTMRGPAFLSIVATTDFYCGGAHPYGFTSAAVFDLKTGQPADPSAWLLPSAKASLVQEDERNVSLEKSVSAAGLLQAYRNSTHHECDDTFSDDQSFLIWPDAKSREVKIQADHLPGCCEACGIETGFTLEKARELGFTELFLQAISDAHRQMADQRPIDVRRSRRSPQ